MFVDSNEADPSTRMRASGSKPSLTHIRGVAHRPAGPHRTPCSTGAVASLSAAGEGHFVAVCVSSTGTSQVPPPPRAPFDISSALKLPEDLLLGAGTPSRAESLLTSSPPLSTGAQVVVQLYSAVGHGGDCQHLLLHPLPVSFTDESPSSVNHEIAADHAQVTQQRRTIAKILWAGPRILVLLNAIGEVVVLDTQLCDCPSSHQHGVESSEESEEDVNEEVQQVLHRQLRITDVTTAHWQWVEGVQPSGPSAVVLLVGHRCIYYINLATGLRGCPRTVHEWPLGTVHCIAATVARDRALWIACCSHQGSLKVYRVNEPNSQPVLVHELLAEPNRSFFGLCLSTAETSPGAPLLSVAALGMERKVTETAALTALRGKDGRQLTVADHLLSSSSADREPLNAVYAALHPKVRGPPNGGRPTMEDIAGTVTIAPPSIVESSSGRVLVNLLTIPEGGGAVLFACQYLDSPSCQATLAKFSGTPLLLPTLRYDKATEAWEIMLHDATGLITFRIPSYNTSACISTAAPTPNCLYSVDDGATLIGVDWSDEASLVLVEGAPLSVQKEEHDADGGTPAAQEKANAKTITTTVDALRMSVVDCPLRKKIPNTSGDTLSPAGDTLVALTALIRGVVREEADRIIVRMDERLNRLEQCLMATAALQRYPPSQ